MARRKVLLHTIPPYDGGVPAKASQLASHLRASGWDVAVAWYATLGYEPDLVAPSWRLWHGPGVRQQSCWDGFPGWAVGCRFPETEVAYYRPSHRWRTIMADFDRHLAVGGNVLVANRLVEAEIPHLLWCATPIEDDRCDRRDQMSPIRRWVDRHVLTPALQRMERRIIDRCPVLMPVAGYGRRRFIELGRRADPVDVLPVPVDTELFRPAAELPALTLGFAGRLDDPRKNLFLLLEAVKLVRAKGIAVQLRLAGPASQALRNKVSQLGLGEGVTFLGNLATQALPDYFRSLGLFVIPSWQEGLGIVGVQAVASGLPVISTRCGGPQDYVMDGGNGYLVDFSADDMASRIIQVVIDARSHRQFGAVSRSIAETRYGLKGWTAALARAWGSVWGDEP